MYYILCIFNIQKYHMVVIFLFLCSFCRDLNTNDDSSLTYNINRLGLYNRGEWCFLRGTD